MAQHRLTARQVETAKPKVGVKATWLNDGGNLYLRVAASGSKSWILRYQVAGQVHDHGLGAYPVVTLAMARDRSLAKRRLIADGVDPIGERRRQAAAAIRSITFADAAEQYQRAQSRSLDTDKAWRGSLNTYAMPILGKLSVADIDTPHVHQVLDPIWNAKAVTAQRLRGRIEAVLDWAKVRGYRSGENPARWSGHLKHSLAKVTASAEHHAAMPYAELPTFMAELRACDHPAARALELAILTACRSGEVLGATWSEIDGEARTWTIPAERMKMAAEHRVPLSGPALALLAALPRQDAKVWGAGCSENQMRNVLKRFRPGMTVHGFRSSFRDWCAETGADHDMSELALAHKVGSPVERAYRRTDMFERRRLLAEAWARHCDGETAGDNVVSLRAG